MHRRFRTALATAAAAALTGGLLTAVAAPAAAAEKLQGDFNGDGYRDVVVSATNATVGGDAGAGQVVVQWGSAAGLNPAQRTTLSQESPGVPGGAEPNDFFGGMTATGDFNGDGVSDLIVGAHGEDLGDDKDAGMVTVLWGSAKGLTSGAVIDDPAPSAHDWFGKALAVGDFDADGRHDLAVGTSAPTVRILSGGLDAAGEPARAGALKTRVRSGEGGVNFLMAGQVDGAGTGDDLVVNGFDSEDDGEYFYNANFYYTGTAGQGLVTPSVKLSEGIVTGIGDTDKDGFGDIVIGTQWDSGTPGSVTGGKVTVLHGTANGPDGAVRTITQDTSGVSGTAETDDHFGSELSLGDVNGDGFMDLAVGAYQENLGEDFDAGMVHVLYGSASGITTTGNQVFDQSTPGVPGENEDEDRFGSDVHLADVNGDGKDDLTIGVYGENDFNGAVVALKSDGARITTTGVTTMGMTSTGISSAGQPFLGINFTG